MKVYLAGPMRGIADFNYPAFHAAAAKLRAEGHTVFNPAERDIEVHGHDICRGSMLIEEIEKKGFSLRRALGEDLSWICAEADCVALLPGWEGSSGAIAELAAARALRLELRFL